MHNLCSDKSVRARGASISQGNLSELHSERDANAQAVFGVPLVLMGTGQIVPVGTQAEPVQLPGAGDFRVCSSAGLAWHTGSRIRPRDLAWVTFLEAVGPVPLPVSRNP